MSKFHWKRILNDPDARQLLWKELGHEDPKRLDESCSINRPVGQNVLIAFRYDDNQGNPACCGIEQLAGKYLFFGEYCADEHDAGPFNDFEEAFGRIIDKDTLDAELISYEVTSLLPLDLTLELCSNHVAEGHSIVINLETFILRNGFLSKV